MATHSATLNTKCSCPCGVWVVHLLPNWKANSLPAKRLLSASESSHFIISISASAYGLLLDGLGQCGSPNLLGFHETLVIGLSIELLLLERQPIGGHLMNVKTRMTTSVTWCSLSLLLLRLVRGLHKLLAHAASVAPAAELLHVVRCAAHTECVGVPRRCFWFLVSGF